MNGCASDEQLEGSSSREIAAADVRAANADKVAEMAAFGGARPKTTVKPREAGRAVGQSGRSEDSSDSQSGARPKLSRHGGGSPLHRRRQRDLHRTNSSDSVFPSAQPGLCFQSRTGTNSVEEGDSAEARDWESRLPHPTSEAIPFLAAANGSHGSSDTTVPSITNSTMSMSDPRSEETSDLENLEGLEDECYIYTYRGGTAYLSADLPNSFFRLDSGSDGESLPGVSGAGQSNLSTEVAALLQDQLLQVPPRPDSPEEQDFLELDFDPGSEDSESSSDSGQGQEEEVVPPVLPCPVRKSPSPLKYLPEPTLLNQLPDLLSPRSGVCSRRTSETSLREAAECVSLSPDLISQPTLSNPPFREIKTRSVFTREIYFPTNNNLAEGGEKTFDDTLCYSCDKPAKPEAPPPVSAVRSVPLTSPVEDVPLRSMPRSKSLNSNISSCLAGERLESEEDNILLCGNRLLLREALLFGMENLDLTEALSRFSAGLRTDRSSQSLPRAMIWSDKEAYRKQVSQVGVSACGATALINVLIALNINVSEIDVCKAVKTRLRREKNDLPDYLLSRSEAGCNHVDLITGVRRLCGDRVVARFFPMHGRVFSLCDWLAGWISRGCVPVATLNVQRTELGPGMPVVADAWHHQMIWGVSGKEVFLTNPLQVLTEPTLLPQLDSPSVLLVRREDVVSRFTCDTDLTALARPELGFGPRWLELNVLGQVVNLLREEGSATHPESETATFTAHVRVPANYVSGVTLFCDTSDQEVLALLYSTADLPARVRDQR